VTSVAQVLKVARDQLGTGESPPGSNMTRYGVWYGMNRVPWCAIFQSWILDQAGYTGYRYAYCPFVVRDARAGKNGLSWVNDPRAGDQILYDWNGDGVADHIGIIEAIAPNGKFVTIEGNTDHDEVRRELRSRQVVLGFCRVNSLSRAESALPTYPSYSSEEGPMSIAIYPATASNPNPSRVDGLEIHANDSIIHWAASSVGAGMVHPPGREHADGTGAWVVDPLPFDSVPAKVGGVVWQASGQAMWACVIDTEGQAWESLMQFDGAFSPWARRDGDPLKL
jgi:hypothetical protein